jgi:hypothetical protein
MQAGGSLARLRWRGTAAGLPQPVCDWPRRRRTTVSAPACGASGSGSGGGGAAAKSARVFTCRHCRQEFSEGDNGPSACQYHPCIYTGGEVAKVRGPVVSQEPFYLPPAAGHPP